MVSNKTNTVKKQRKHGLAKLPELTKRNFPTNIRAKTPHKPKNNISNTLTLNPKEMHQRIPQHARMTNQNIKIWVRVGCPKMESFLGPSFTPLLYFSLGSLIQLFLCSLAPLAPDQQQQHCRKINGTFRTVTKWGEGLFMGSK